MPLLFQKIIGKVVSFLLVLTGKKVMVHNPHILIHATKPLLIVSNHRYSLDHFYLSYAFLQCNPQLFPLYFIGKKSFRHPGLLLLWYTGVIPLLYAMAGVLTVERGLGIDRNIQGALEKLKTGNSVVIYPEGKVNKTDMPLLPLKPGAAALAYRSATPVLPVYIEYRRGVVHITVDKPFVTEEPDYMKSTAHIAEKLLMLSRRNV